MKKNVLTHPLLFCLFILMAPGVFAQRFYFSGGAGYAFAASGENLGTTRVGTSEQVVSGSFGKGMNYGATFGYKTTDFISLEFGVIGLKGDEYSFKDTLNITEKASGSMLRLLAALKFSAPSNDPSARLYARAGVVIGVKPGVLVVTSSPKSSGGFSVNGTDTYSGGSSLGLTGALGVDSRIGKMFDFFIEVNFISQSWAPKQDDYSYTIGNNGYYDEVGGTFRFVDTAPSNSNPLLSGQLLKKYYPFSCITIYGGLKFNFGKKEITKKS